MRKIATICNVVGGLLLIVVILLCIPLTIPRLGGYQIYTVVSGSMEPAIPIGSLVYVHQVEPAEVEEKEVIAFYSSTDSGAIITHRVVKNRVVSGEIVTKGDANDAQDPMPVEYEQVLGKVTLSIPTLGGVLSMFATVQGKIAAGCLIGIALLLHIIAARLQRKE